MTSYHWIDGKYPFITRQAWAKNGLPFWAAGKQTAPHTKIVLHSTETTGFPGYRNGADAPHFTIDLRTGAVRQHIPLDYGARALEIRGTRSANVAGVVQIEIVGAVTPGYPAKYGHYDLVNTLPNDKAAIGHLARLLAAIHTETGIPLTSTVKWVKYPASYGDNASQRLTVDAYLAYKGVLGHQHVPGNAHGDPGALPIGAVLAAAQELTGTASKPAAAKPRPAAKTPAKPARLKVDGKAGALTVTALQRALGTHPDGIVSSQNPRWASLFDHWPAVEWTAAYKGSPLVRALQRHIGTDVDGLLGPGTATALQRYLNREHGAGLVVDGKPRANTVKALQKALNTGRF